MDLHEGAGALYLFDCGYFKVDRYRWSIEVVFRWLKYILQLDHFRQLSSAGIIHQVVTAVVWDLLVIYNQDEAPRDFGPEQLWHELQAAMHQALFDFGQRRTRPPLVVKETGDAPRNRQCESIRVIFL